MRNGITNGQIPFKKACLRRIVDKIAVRKTEAVIFGCKSRLRNGAVSGTSRGAMAPTDIQEWRATLDKTANTYVIEIAI